jgi:predicted permease
MHKWLRRIHYLLNRHRLEKELEDEMAAHRELMDLERRSAFGNTLQIREQTRDVWGWRWMDDLRQDLHHGTRGFVRDRRVAVSALLAIALAVGAAASVFSVVDRSLFRPLPYRDGDRLVTVGLVLPSWGPRDVMFAGAYRDWQFTQKALDLTFWEGISACDLGGDSPQRLNCARAESTFLPTLGVQPFLGRNFTPDEDSVAGGSVALVSFTFWRNHLGSDVRVLDRHILLDGKPARIVGVLPATFETPDLQPVDLLLPRKLARERTRNVEIHAIGRLRPNQTIESARAALDPLFQSFRADFGVRVGDNFAKTMRLRITKLRDQQVRQYRMALWMLLGAVIAFVLVACANVGNLLLARSIARKQEFGIRTALGASRQRLARQMLTESGLLALVGGSAGCLLAWWFLRLAIALAPDGVLRLRQAGLDARVLTFALVLSLFTALLFGLAPSLHRLRAEVLAGARVVRRRGNWIGQGLVIGQISASVVLLTAAGLFLMSLWRLQNAPLGFEQQRMITASFTLPQYRYANEARQMEFFRQLEERLNDLPGTVAAAITDSLPPGEETRRAPVANKTGSEIVGSVRWRYVTPGYFEALGIPIKLGRSFVDADRHPGDLPIILSERLWRSEFDQADPIGTRTGRGWPRVVVGVAGDVRNNGLANSPDPEFYVVRKTSREGVPGDSDPAWWRRGTAVVRTTVSHQAASAFLQSAFHQLDPDLPVQIRSMEDELNRYLVRPRFQTVLLSAFAFTALVLAGIGLYGLISFLVAERTREVGVRIALGATPGAIIKMVVSDAGRWANAGVVIGTLWRRPAHRAYFRPCCTKLNRWTFVSFWER